MRQKLIDAIERRLGRKKLIWFGTRGEDAQPLLSISQFSEAFSLIAPLKSVSVRPDQCLESIKGRRLDLDSYSLDADNSEEAVALRQSLLESVREPAAILPYRPLAFLSSVYYPRSGHVDYLGLFHERQAPFEHKPWVESELRSAGIRTVPWEYFADEDRQWLEDHIGELGSAVLRTNRTDGGAGFHIINTRQDLESWKPHAERFFAAAPLLVPHVPININACLFPDGELSLHGVSVQLIGIDGCTKRSFGYCGNDFQAIRNLEPQHLDQLENLTRNVAAWLTQKGYIGAFGIDALLHEDTLYLTEINPRFQGSSALSAYIDAQNDRSDLFLCHLAAFLGLPPSEPDMGVRDLVHLQGPISQIIVHNTLGEPVSWIADEPENHSQYRLVPNSDIGVEKEAVLFKRVVERSVTCDGFCIDQSEARAIQEIVSHCFCRRQLEILWGDIDNV